jgi:3-hydroxyisobutyrate dehydrogenase-like beta-hydroxyacid dehydrogenase
VADKSKGIGDTCEITIICVNDYQAVANLSFMTGASVETTIKDVIVIQCSTISPKQSNKVAEQYSNNQMSMLALPIVGGTTAVERGELSLIGADPKTAYELAEPILKDLSPHIFYLGSHHRTASALKLAININIALMALALAEGMVFVRGIETGTFVKILNSTYFKAGICEKKGPRIVNDDYAASFYLMNRSFWTIYEGLHLSSLLSLKMIGLNTFRTNDE